MGHVRRATNLIDEIVARRPEAAILLATGSSALDALLGRHPNLDVVKLPTVAPTGGSDDKPSHLPIGDGAIVAIRRQVLLALMGEFRPHALYVDNFALGARKELAPTLAMLRRTPTRTILGLRDIIDAPEAIQERWPRDGVLDALRDLYDEVLVFGAPEVFDLAEEYALDGPLRDKLRYCGYVAREAAPASEARMAELGLGRPSVVVTVGGGGDGAPLVRGFLEAAPGLPELSALVVTGPLMGARVREGLEALAAESGGRVTLRDFVPDLPALMAAADLVVSMGGYNTVAEILRSRCRALIVPRNWRYGQHGQGAAAGLEMEQPLRARMLERAGLAACLSAEGLTPEGLRGAIRRALSLPRPAARMPFEGAGRGAEAILAQAEQGRLAHAV
jgi:predicted glycosyltransferase